MKAIETFSHVVLFIMLCKIVLTSESVNETLVCDHSEYCSADSDIRFFLFVFIFKFNLRIFP